MKIHELNDDGVMLGGENLIEGATRCGVRGAVVVRDRRRYLRTPTNTYVALPLLQSVPVCTGPLLLGVKLEPCEPPTCHKCRYITSLKKRHAAAP